jgi:hypothetical protein
MEPNAAVAAESGSVASLCNFSTDSGATGTSNARPNGRRRIGVFIGLSAGLVSGGGGGALRGGGVVRSSASAAPAAAGDVGSAVVTFGPPATFGVPSFTTSSVARTFAAEISLSACNLLAAVDEVGTWTVCAGGASALAPVAAAHGASGGMLVPSSVLGTAEMTVAAATVSAGGGSQTS